jgi:hypothetical protein
MLPEKYSRTAAYGAGLGLFGWFVYLIRAGLRSWFSADDLMNLHYYWVRPWSALLKADLFFWSSYYRPGGGLFYRVIYSLWGFHPLPFRIAVFIFLCANFVLLAIVVRQLTASRWAALLALLLVGIHPMLVALYFDTGTIYDVLVYLFFWSAFAWYVHIRQRGHIPGPGGLVALLCLFAAALDSKEIAVLLPVTVALYELVWYPPLAWKPGALWRWIYREGRFAAMGAVFDVAFIIGKRYGPDSLWQVEAYRPHYSAAAYIQSLSHYLHELTYQPDLKPRRMVMLLAAMLVIAVTSRRRCLIWAWAFVMVGVLPLAFIPDRAGFAYIVPSVGWAVYAAGLLDWLVDLIAAKRVQVRAAAQVLVLFLLAIFLAPWQRHWIVISGKAAHEMQHRFLRYQNQILALIPAPRPGAKILLLTDADGYADWDVYFLIRLTYGDPKLQAYRMSILREYHTPVDPSTYDYVLDYGDGHFTLIAK